MNKMLIAGGIFWLGMVWMARADDPPQIAFRLTPLDLRPITVARTTPTDPFTLAPGTYLSVPYSMIVVVPAPMDQGIVTRSQAVATKRIFQPPTTFVPVPR